MSVESNIEKLTTMRMNEFSVHFAQHRERIEALIREVVEIESPSGDEKGSSEVVERFARAAGEINAVSVVERIEVSGYGEHLSVTAFGEAMSDAFTSSRESYSLNR